MKRVTNWYHKTQRIKLLCIGLLLLEGAAAQNGNTMQGQGMSINTGAFNDNAGHWYGIYDKGNVVNPRAGQPKYKPTDLANIGDNILLYQKNNGGWPKNYDILAILTDDQKDSLVKAKDKLNTTFDNGTTYTHVEALAMIYNATKVDKYKDASLKGLEYILAAQYKNGGWPQYYPLESNYSRHITFNDGAFKGIMLVLKDVDDGVQQYAYIQGEQRQKLRQAYHKGLDCVLKTQINDNGKPTAWCQQYDEVTLQPTWARAFEPPSICNQESSDIVQFLMSLDRPSKEIIEAVQNAVAWFMESRIFNTRVKVISAPEMKTPFRISKSDRVVVADSTAPPIWTRYYELKTHRPLFCNRDSKVVYSLAEVDRERRDGYAWYGYGPQKVLDKYTAWQQKWAPGKNTMQQRAAK